MMTNRFLNDHCFDMKFVIKTQVQVQKQRGIIKTQYEVHLFAITYD